ncbi:MAG: hypothetical protein JW927_09775 [Deltaproteobacteria bacterium]|nr:hypothetical protein [Deltaproteobacteria bacterium]
MSSDQNNRRIKNLLVNQGIQHRVIAVNLLFMILVIFITMLIIYSHLLEREYGSEAIWKFAFGEFTISLSLKLILLYLLLALTFFISIIAQLRMTHRVCGPLVNFCNTFNKIYSGDLLGRVQLRKKDLLKKEAEAFNEMVNRVCELVNELKMENERLNSAIRAVDKDCQL